MDSSIKDVISYKSLFRILLFVVGVFVVYELREVVGLLFVALVFSSAISPWVETLSKRSIPRGVSILVIFLVLVIVLGGAIALMVPLVLEEIAQIAKNFPEYYQKVSSAFFPVKGEIPSQTFISTSEVGQLPDTAIGALKSIISTVSSIFGGVISFLVVLVLTFYMTVEENGVKKFFSYFTPLQYQQYLSEVLSRIQKKMGLWLRAQLILMLIVGVMTYIGLSILQVKYALLLSLVAGITEVIPYVGPVLGSIPAIIIGFGESPLKGLFVILLYTIVQQAENHLLVPKIMQKTVGLHPILVIVAILIGAKLGGAVGAILAIPVAIAAVMLGEDYYNLKTGKV